MFSRPGSSIFVPDGMPVPEALGRTTHLGVGAHPDDLEILAIHGILACFERQDRWFAGVVVTDGVGSPQGAEPLDAAALRAARRHEQEQAATLGKYGAVALLDHSSADVKNAANRAVIDDLVALLRATRAEVVYTHALTDGHDTHVAVTLRLLAACRELAPSERPPRVLGCEVWRDLDWLTGEDKVALPVDEHPELQRDLIRAFTTQVDKKAYDDATLGRRRAHAAFSESHAADRHRGLAYAMDLTPLVASGADDSAIATYVRGLVGRLAHDSVGRIVRVVS